MNVSSMKAELFVIRYKIIAKSIYHAMNVSSMKAELFVIRYKIS